jgi:hypothetical protein
MPSAMNWPVDGPNDLLTAARVDTTSKYDSHSLGIAESETFFFHIRLAALKSKGPV